MGAGNELIKTWSELDEILYKPETFFIDLSVNDEELEKYNQQEIADGEISKSRQYFEDENYEHFKTNEIDFLFEEAKLNTSNNYDDLKGLNVLSASFRGSVILLESTDNLLFITTSSETYMHISFGFVPNFKYEEIYDEIYNERISREDWYEKRNLSYHDKICSLTEIKYNRLLKPFLKEKKALLKLLLKYHKNKISIRTSAWTSEIYKQ